MSIINCNTNKFMMNTINEGPENGSGIPTLINKLCLLFAKDDQELAARLYKRSMSFLSASNYGSHANNDEQFQYTSLQVRKHIQQTHPREKVESFDLYHTQIQESSVLHQKSNLLTFFLILSKGVSSRESNDCISVVNDFSSVPSSSACSKMQVHFIPDDNKVKKIYQSNIRNFSGISSSRSTVQNSSRSLASGMWTNSDQDLLKDRLSSSSSSRSNFTSVTESQLMEEVMFSFQGIEGRVIRKEPGSLGFAIDAKMGKTMTPIQRGLIERLVGVGFLHNELKLHCDEADKQIGLIGQSLIAILREELTDYYQLVSLLQTQLRKKGCVDNSDLTLRRMVVWVAEPQLHLQWLAHIAELCSDKKGGALISVVHGFLQHGAQNVQNVSEKVLSAVCRPLYLMLSRWLLDGELNDPCGEFFIEARSINAAERLWHDKYHVRTAMIPSFITMDQANKILATGKSINFLRQICKDNEELPGRDALYKLFTTASAEALYAPEQSLELHSALESVYRETSLRVLDLLKNKYRLLEHLQALRRYLLLGQGDFIRHLLELLAPELSKRANELYGHTLTAILESAIRVTNAQYEDEDTLMRLNVGLMENSRDDTGWDVFTLVYLADGPVGTIFQPTVPTYKSLFGGLWKAKRMEFVLANMRKQQISCHKLYRKMIGLRPVTHAVHVLASEMIHFLHQTQYYFLFEVLECSWAEMLRQVNHAGCLDDVITAHSTFLTSVQCGVLLDGGSDELRSTLRMIFNLVLNLETLQETLYSAASNEQELNIAYIKKCNSKTGFGITLEIEEENKERISKFKLFLSSIQKQVSTLSVTYKNLVRKYLKLLAASSDMNLQLLSTRINFNDYYKIT